MKVKRLFILAAAAGLLTVACTQGEVFKSVVGAAPPQGKPEALIGQDRVVLPQAGRARVEESGRHEDAAPAAPPGAPAPAEQTRSDDRMIVYNANVSLEVESVGDAVAAVRSLMDSTGGIVAGAATKFQGEQEYATLTLRVPATEYNRVMSELRGLAVKVTSENTSGKDVTEEFTDLGSQLRNFEATEAQYLELLRRANTIDEILKVQQRLTEVRGQIERTKGRMNLLQRTSDMATITVNLAPVGAPAPKGPRPVWDPARSVQEAWEQSLRLVGAVADAGLRAVVFSWWLAPLGLLAWGVWSARRRPATARSPLP